MPEAPALGPARAALVRVAAALATREAASVDAALRAAAREAPSEAVDEVILQSHLFVGFPTALEAFFRWRELRPSPPAAATAEPPELWASRGPAVCERVYGRSYAKLRANVQALHPELDRWMVEGGYGRVLGREALDLATRELCIAALLAVWDAPRQLHSHLRGALNAGASVDEVAAALEIARAFLNPRDAGRVNDVWQTVCTRRGASRRA